MNPTESGCVELPDHVEVQYDNQPILRIFSDNPDYRIIQENEKIIFKGKDWTYLLPKQWEVITDTDDEGNDFALEHVITIYNGDKLGQYLSYIPYGIINKFITGIGATTTELRAERNSIIVVPTKSLALSKYKQFPDSLYVGSTIENCITSPTDGEIAAYIERTDIHKKILVVADSLPRVLDTIRKERYSDYFYMIDEIDTIQMDSYFRPKLEYVLDCYFEFPAINRAMVSATVKPLSHPGLEGERRISYRYETMPQKNCSLTYTDDPDLALKEKLEFLIGSTRKKIVVAYNSPSRIMRIIRSLRKNIQKQCSVLCGEKNKAEMSYYNRRTGEEIIYYRELIDTSLETRITFITSAYFVGLDITEPFHLISVANAAKPYTLLSVEKMIQIAGRCRCPQGILSDTIIYNIRKHKRIDTKEYAQYIHNRVDKALEYCRMGEEFLPDPALIESIKAHVQGSLLEQLSGEPDLIPLLRWDIYGNLAISYNNIDALVERCELINNLYSSPEQLKEHLESMPNVTVTCDEKLYGGSQSLPTTLVEEVNESKETLDMKELEEVLIPALKAGEKINSKDLKRRRSHDFLNAFWELIRYINKEELIGKLIEESKDSRRLRNYSNEVRFWALANNHPFKVSIFSAFKKGEVYTRKEIHTKLCECFRVNGLRPPADAGKSVQLLSTFFIHKRPNSRKDKYCIGGRYSYRITYGTLHKKIINSKLSPSDVFDF